MKVLVIAYHFPPDPAVGAIRAGRVVEALVARGHQVHVLAAMSGSAEAWTGKDGIVVERLKPTFDPRGMYAWLRTMARRLTGRSRESGPQPVATEVWVEPDRVGFVKRNIFALLWLPDDRHGWLFSVIRRGRALLGQGFDLVYTTAPPFSAHVAALVLGGGRRLTWVAEFRDPWTGNPWKPAFVRTRWSDAADRWLERRCLTGADHVVSVTEAVGRQLRGRLGSEAGKVTVVLNGIDGAVRRDHSTNAPDGPVRFLYVGNLYHGRDPRPFLKGLAELCARGDLPAEVRADFIGECRTFRGVDIEAHAHELGLGDVVHVGDPVPHEACLRLIASASVLLLLAQDQPLQVPNKLYEYLAAGRPILAFADADGETAHMLRLVGAHQIITDPDPKAVREKILAAIRADDVLDAAGEELLREWQTDRQLGRLVRLMEESENGVG